MISKAKNMTFEKAIQKAWEDYEKGIALAGEVYNETVRLVGITRTNVLTQAINTYHKS